MVILQKNQECFIHALYFIQGMEINDKIKRHRKFVKLYIALKTITHGSTRRLCSTTNNLSLG